MSLVHYGYDGRRLDYGESLVDFPEDYVVLDTETTGLVGGINEIIQISLLRYRERKLVESYSTFVKPVHPIPKNITALTHISDEDVKDAPSMYEITPLIANFIQGETLVGYNVTFDLEFLYYDFLRYLNKEIKNDYVDVYRLARQLIYNLDSYKQTRVASFLGIDFENAHRADVDCEICNGIYEKLRERALKEGYLFEKYHHLKKKMLALKHTSALKGKKVAFIHNLKEVNRHDAKALVELSGGDVVDNVTMQTDYLVVGTEPGFRSALMPSPSTKEKMAKELQSKGVPIILLDESSFYQTLLAY